MEEHNRNKSSFRAKWDKQVAMIDSEEKGRREEALKITKALKERGVPIAIIADATAISAEEISVL